MSKDDFESVKQQAQRAATDAVIGMNNTGWVARPYKKPKLVCHGKIIDQTLGGSPGTGESGPAILLFLP